MNVELWTDGSGTASGPFAWAWVLRAERDGEWVERHGGGFGCDGTSQRAELMALLEGLRALSRPAEVTVFTDSQYLSKGFTEYLPQWVARDWRRLTRGAVVNRDLWEAIVMAGRPHTVEFTWIKGHTGFHLNERCDRLAGAMRRLLVDELAKDTIREEAAA